MTAKRRCSKCHKEADRLQGVLGGDLFCDSCYVPKEKRGDYNYVPDGKVKGRIENIPEAKCRVCGGGIHQPLPTGIWIHYGYHSDEFEDNQDHMPVPASVIEDLLIMNSNEGRHHPRYECRLHRKYWLSQTTLSNSEIKKMIGAMPDGADFQFFRYFWKRLNSLAFEKFVKSSAVKTLKKNPPNPKIFIVYNFGSKVLKEYEIPYDDSRSWFYTSNHIVKFGKKVYIIRGETEFRKITPMRGEFSVTLANLGKYEKERMLKMKSVPDIDSLFVTEKELVEIV